MRGPTDTPAEPGPAPARSAAPAGIDPEYAAIQTSPQFQELRSRYRRFVFPVTGAALLFYFLYVLLAAYAPGFMAEKVSGNVNVGLVFGALQFVMVFAVTTLYVRFARTTLDPLAERIRGDHARLDAEAGK